LFLVFKLNSLALGGVSMSSPRAKGVVLSIMPVWEGAVGVELRVSQSYVYPLQPLLAPNSLWIWSYCLFNLHNFQARPRSYIRYPGKF
jgi:hypothetical protein